MLKNLLGHKPTYLKAVILYFISFSFLRKTKSFVFEKANLPYFHHRYNLTWLNERRIEIPVAVKELEGKSENRLEVGNVLSHYMPVVGDIVDKYEFKKEGVINVDAAEYNPPKKYDFIISLSTVEHIGLDEGQDSFKAVQAIKHLSTLLSKNGKMFISFPVGYNPSLDQWILGNENFFDKVVFMKRINVHNEWEEVSKNVVSGTKFSSPYPLGNVIAFCTFMAK